MKKQILAIVGVFVFSFLFVQNVSAATTAVLLPSAQGSYVDWDGGLAEVDETLITDNSCATNPSLKGIETDITAERESFSVNLSSIPDGSTITSVQISVWDRKSGGSGGGTYKTSAKLNGTDTDASSELSATTGDVSCSPEKTQNIDVSDAVKSGTTTLEIGVIKTATNTNGVIVGAIRAVVTYTEPVVPADTDGDGVPDSEDNCPAVANAGQTDTDGDTDGDDCDSDDDGDGQSDADETSCDSDPLDAESMSLDTDEDGSPDCVDSDDDGDTIADEGDNCPLTDDVDQTDTDGDGAGNPCDSDDDGDEVADDSDNCPFVSNADQIDTDEDGTGDDCVDDDDGDGVIDEEDNCPAVSSEDQTDTDGDGAGNPCDEDDDNDEVADGDDAFPFDSEESADADDDGVGDNADNCDADSNPDQTDTDNDGQGNPCDSDDDNDGDSDVEEGTCESDPLNSESTCPTEGGGGGGGGGEDLDADDDGINDDTDNCPAVANPDQTDTDGAEDGGDACDSDDDNDGIVDGEDEFPLDATNNAGSEDDNDNTSTTSSGSVARTTGSGEVLGAANFVFTKFMIIGSTGPEVLELQKFLQSLGLYWGKLDGIFGVLTEAGVKAFQMAHPPLVVDGIVGPKTLEVLNKN